MVNYCLVLPYLPGGIELVKKFAEENTNTKEHDEFYKIAGVTREGFNVTHKVLVLILKLLAWRLMILQILSKSLLHQITHGL
jgi:hypothetical protein